MKTKYLIYNVFAILLSISFVFKSLPEINEHTYTTGVINIHMDFSCINRIPTHIDYYCDDYKCY